MKYYFLLYFSLLLLFSCKKEAVSNPIPSFSDTPVISLISVSSTTVRQFTDSIIFTIKYQDGNGDIGYEFADSMSLFLIDTRVPLTFAYHIPPVAPIGSDIDVEGTYEIVLDHTIIFDPALNPEITIFEIKLKDRANNWSNTLLSPIITIIP